MKVNIKRTTNGVPLPKHESSGAVGVDLCAAEDAVIKPKEITVVHSGIIVEVPKGYMLVIAPRSSTPRKTGLFFPHSIGIIDQDYCGPEDEILIQVYNFTDKEVTVKKGDRIAQGIFVKIETAEWVEVDSVEHNKTRGSFGSTGSR